MVEINPAQLALAMLTMVLLSALGAMLLGWGWMFWRLYTGQSLLPTHPLVSLSPPSWRGGTVFLAFSTYVVMNVLVAGVYTRALGRVPAKPGAAVPPAAESVPTRESAKDGHASNPADRSTNPVVRGKDLAGKTSAEQAHGTTVDAKVSKPTESDDEDGTFSRTEQMFLVSVINCLLMVILPLLIRATSGARLRDLGLSFKGWERQAAVGAATTLIAAPAVYSIQFASLLIWKANAHPLEKMLRKEFVGLGVADLAVVSAVILAPIVEELMFRGLLQRWCIDFLTRRAKAREPMPQPADTLVPATTDVAVARELEAWPEFTAAAMAESKGVRAPSPVGVTVGITMTSFLFAVVHAPQWPAPIPLFVLALIIGSVYHRTGSLIAAIFMHATFNGFSTLAMFVAILGGHEKEAGKAIDGVWRTSVVIVSGERGVGGVMTRQLVWEKRNSSGFLLDESVSD
jgi:membrane protease YdiL (CAAX protease family)